MIGKILVKLYGSIWNLKNYSQQSKNRFLKKISLTIYELYQYENSSSIAYNSSFVNEPCFPHGMKSIFISGDAIIGSNCIIFQQVTIGSVTLPDARSMGAPVIGDNCYIGAGAKIIGKVNIGNNVRIGANTVVYKDVPDNSIVVSSEQKNIIKSDSLDNKFYTYKDKWMYYEDAKFIEVEDETIIFSLESEFRHQK